MTEKLISELNSSDRESCNKLYFKVLETKSYPVMKELCKHDLFFLLTKMLGVSFADNDFVFDRCREVKKNPNGYLDLWSREHFKSTIITYALTIQDILRDPEITIGIFCFTSSAAKNFLSQIKETLEGNVLLKLLFPEVLYDNPSTESTKWSLDRGIVVKRKGTPKEPTVGAHGFIEGLPTGHHYKIRVYDDIITEKHVSNPEMIQKSIDQWEQSLNLGSQVEPDCYPGEKDIERYVGTRYHFNDTYNTLMKRKAAIPRVYAGSHDGTPEGKPLMWDQKTWEKKRRNMGAYIFSCQICQNPVADRSQGFREEWLEETRYSPKNLNNMNMYLLCDPAGEKKKTNDYTVMLVIGLGPDNNYYLIDGIRDRLNLTERTSQLMRLHRKYRPLMTGYEKYGKDSDIEHIKSEQENQNYRFTILTLAGNMPKNDRIKMLVPVFETGRFYLPHEMKKVRVDGSVYDFVEEFIEDEYLAFPVPHHDDMLDCMARILHPELKACFPEYTTDEMRRDEILVPNDYDPLDYAE